MTFKSPGSPKSGHLGGFRDSNLEVPGKRAILDVAQWGVAEYIIWGMVVASPESEPW
jgi:hypothetical protein